MSKTAAKVGKGVKTPRKKSAKSGKERIKSGNSKAAAARAGLNAKQQVFVVEYLIDKNATQAAIRAGYSKNSAASIGEENLRKPEIRKAVDEGMAKLLNSLEITAERTMLERARMAYYDIGDIAKEKISSPGDIAKLPKDLRQAVVGWKWDAQGNFVVLFSDKHPHLSAIDKYLGLNEKDNEQKNPLADLLDRLGGNGLKPVK